MNRLYIHPMEFRELDASGEPLSGPREVEYGFTWHDDAADDWLIAGTTAKKFRRETGAPDPKKVLRWMIDHGGEEFTDAVCDCCDAGCQILYAGSEIEPEVVRLALERDDEGGEEADKT